MINEETHSYFSALLQLRDSLIPLSIPAVGLVSVLMYELNPPQRRMTVAVFGQFSATYAQMLLGLTSFGKSVNRDSRIGF